MWNFEVQCPKPGQPQGTGEWQKVCPSGGPPYEYETEGEAWAMARMCYPDQIAFYGTVRVVKAEEKP
jgi:hypothetical protein